MRRRDVSIWDTQYVPRSAATNVFRRGICASFMPWAVQFGSVAEFEGRLECMNFDGGAVGKISITDASIARSTAEICDSPSACIYAVYMLSGELRIEQAGRCAVAQKGDLVFHDSAITVAMSTTQAGRFEGLIVMVNRGLLNLTDDVDSAFNRIVRADKLITPLADTMRYIADNLLVVPKSELASVFGALTLLVPVATARSEPIVVDISRDNNNNRLMSQICDYVQRNVANADLTPNMAAQGLSISVRYLHKVVAASGETFNSYVTGVRLDWVAATLRSENSGGQAIAELALNIGFRDLTTFNRTFRRRFGCSPRQYRQQIGRVGTASIGTAAAVTATALAS